MIAFGRGKKQTKVNLKVKLKGDYFQLLAMSLTGLTSNSKPIVVHSLSPRAMFFFSFISSKIY